MVYYECFRCGYSTKFKSSLINHLNRKNICSPILDDISVEEVNELYGFCYYKTNCSKIDPISLQITPKSLQITPTSLQNNSKSLHFEDSKKTCEYCLRTYKRKDNLTKHLKTCKKKEEAEMIIITNDDEMNKMKKEIEELKNLKNQTNINNTNNITNNGNNIININNYGAENLKHLRSKDFANILNGIYGAVPKLIEKIHFDPKHPENHNIKFTNKKLPYLKVMKNDKWQLVNKKHELLDLIDNKCYMLKEKYYAILEKKKYNITEVHRNKIEEFMKKYHEEDKKMTLDLIERTELMLLNNS